MNTMMRRQAILDMLQKEHQVKVTDLSQQFGVSEITIRRDLSDLSQQYNISRIHGGAVLSQDSIVRIISFEENLISHKQEKDRIARKAAEMVEYRQRIFIDAGSTTRLMIDYLDSDLHNVVVTNNLHVASVALQKKSLSVIMLGGEMLRTANCSSGVVAEEQIKRYQFDFSFLGAAAIGPDGNMYDGYSPEARLKGTVLKVSSKIFLLADSSKFNTYDLHDFGSLKSIHAVITDEGIDKMARTLLEKYDVEVIIAK